MEREISISAAGDRLVAVAKKKKCLCGFAFGDRENKIYCQDHYDDLAQDRDAWKKLAHELLGHLERYWKFNS